MYEKTNMVIIGIQYKEQLCDGAYLYISLSFPLFYFIFLFVSD